MLLTSALGFAILSLSVYFLQTLWSYDLAMEFCYPNDISSEKKPEESITLNGFGH